MFRTFLIAIAGFVVSAVIAFAAVVFGTLLAWEVLGIRDRDGGDSMALVFVIAPAVALFVGLFGAVLAPMLWNRRAAGVPPSPPAAPGRDARRFAVLGGVVSGAVLGHYTANLGFWLVSPLRFDTYWKAWAVSWVPMVVAVLGAIAGAWLAARIMRGRSRGGPSNPV